MTIMEIDTEEIEKIYALGDAQCAYLVRFAPIDHKYFDKTKPYHFIFNKHFESMGGMNPRLSKLIDVEAGL